MKLVEDTLRKEPETTPANKTAVLYVGAYLYEHREDADMWTEKSNDDISYDRMATQEDFDKF